jgi:hypothetical protein
VYALKQIRVLCVWQAQSNRGSPFVCCRRHRYLLFTIGLPLQQKEIVNCTRGAPHPAPAPYTANVTTLHSSPSLNGPWTLVPGADGEATLLAGFTNPAPYVLPNGTVVVLGIPQGCCTCANGGCLHAATAPHWSGPYTIHTDKGLFGWPMQGGAQKDDRLFVFEDPYLWWSSDKLRYGARF